MTGIVSTGAYIPQYRLKVSDVASVWGKDGRIVGASIGISEKSVAGVDEDAVTLGYEAANQALKGANINPQQIQALFVGSESHPYAVNPTSTTIGEFLGIGHNYFSADLQFACKAATTGLIITTGLIETKKIKYGLVVGTDCAQAKPHDAMEYSAAAGSAAIILGDEKGEVLAEINDFCSFSSDTPDFWRRDGIIYPSHGGRFTAEPAYYTHVVNAGRTLLKKTKSTPEDYTSCVFHMPNAKFPQVAARRLGFKPEQLEDSLIVNKIGNPYCASSLLGLVAVLEQASSGDKIFFVSYGSGAGSDAIVFEVTDNIKKIKKGFLRKMISDKKYIDYVTYLKMRGAI